MKEAVQGYTGYNRLKRYFFKYKHWNILLATERIEIMVQKNVREGQNVQGYNLNLK